MDEQELMKEERFAKFISENPTYFQYDEHRLNILEQKEKRVEKRLDIIKRICELRYKNKLTLVQIGEEYGVSKQRIEQRLKGLN